MNIKTTAITILMALSPVILCAQSLPFTSVDYNAASLGKGGASIVQTSSISGSAFTNASAIPFSDLKADLTAGYTMWAPGGVPSNVLGISGAYNLNQKLGIAVGFTYGANPAYDIMDDKGAVKGQFKPSDMQLSAGFSYRFLSFLSLGANVGYASSKLAEGTSYGSLVADVFLMAKFGGFKLAAGASELGTGITSVSGQKYGIPSAASLGLGYDAVLGEKNGIEILADADYYFSGGLAAALGACYTFDKMISVRAGYRYGGKSVIPSFFSLGAGVHFAGFKLDVAYLMGEGVGNTLALTAGYRF